MSVLRYQHARRNDVSPIPLAGVSGENGTTICEWPTSRREGAATGGTVHGEIPGAIERKP